MANNSADSRIALLIETRADLTGVRAARTETTSLSNAVKASANETAAAQQKVTLTTEQARRAAAEAGGDFTKLQAVLARMVSEENALATATTKATAELQAQAKAPTSVMLAGPAGPQLGPALPGLNTAQAAAASAAAAGVATNIQKIPGAARTASNSLGLLTQAVVTGQGGMNGIAVAAGNVAQGISLMSGSAKAAATASGIGALIAITIVAVEALAKLTETAKTSQLALDHIANFSTRQLGAARQELAALDVQIGAAQKRASDASKYDIPGVPSLGAKRANQELDNLLEKRNTLAQKERELSRESSREARNRTLAGIAIEAQAQTTAQGRYRAQLAEIEAERIEAVRSRELTQEAADARAAGKRRALAKSAEDYAYALGEATTTHLDAVQKTSFQARIDAANRAAAKEKADLQDRALDSVAEVAATDLIELKRRGIVALVEREKAATLAMSAARRDSESDNFTLARKGKIALIEAEYQADLKVLGAEEALAVRRAKTERLDREADVALATSVAQRASAHEDERIALQGKLDLIALEERADATRLGATEAQAIADEKRRRLQKTFVDEGLAGYAKLTAVVKNHGTVLYAVAKAGADAVRLYEIYEKGKSAAISAQIEGAASLAAFGSGNFVGGALHAAAAGGYAAAALAAGVEAVSGGGAGGASGGATGGQDSTTFQPRGTGDAGGSVTIILQTMNPSGREVIAETRYQLERAGTLKRPIPIAPTTGLMRTG